MLLLEFGNLEMLVMFLWNYQDSLDVFVVWEGGDIEGTGDSEKDNGLYMVVM